MQGFELETRRLIPLPKAVTLEWPATSHRAKGRWVCPSQMKTQNLTDCSLKVPDVIKY